MKKYFIVWNADKTKGVVVDEEQLAYEIRKGNDSNCYDQHGYAFRTGQKFCDEFAEHNCTIQIIEVKNV